MMRREKLEHLVTFRIMEGKCSSGKHRDKMLDVAECKMSDTFTKSNRYQDEWKVMIAFTKLNITQD